MSFANNLAEVIEKKKLQQQQVADAVGVSKTAISYIVTGKMIPGLVTAKRIADYVEVPLDELMK